MRGPNTASTILIACCLSLAWLATLVLPLALYQYFAISTPGVFADVVSIAWFVYLTPLGLIGWTPTFSSVDPLVTLIPSFALTFTFWSVVLSIVVAGLRWLRRRGARTRDQASS
jgi:hypothetical protein